MLFHYIKWINFLKFYKFSLSCIYKIFVKYGRMMILLFGDIKISFFFINRNTKFLLTFNFRI